jgi:hypothetical protein
VTNRVLPDEAEAIIAHFSRMNFVEHGRGLDRPTLKTVVLMFIQSMIAGAFLDDTGLILNVQIISSAHSCGGRI